MGSEDYQNWDYPASCGSRRRSASLPRFRRRRGSSATTHNQTQRPAWRNFSPLQRRAAAPRAAASSCLPRAGRPGEGGKQPAGMEEANPLNAGSRRKKLRYFRFSPYNVRNIALTRLTVPEQMILYAKRVFLPSSLLPEEPYPSSPSKNRGRTWRVLSLICTFAPLLLLPPASLGKIDLCFRRRLIRLTGSPVAEPEMSSRASLAQLP